MNTRPLGILPPRRQVTFASARPSLRKRGGNAGGFILSAVLVITTLASCAVAAPSPMVSPLPSPVEERLRAGDAHANLGERGAAESAYLEAIALSPHDPSPYLRLAHLYLDWNRGEEGLTALVAAERLGGPNSRISSLRASLFASQGDWEAAATYGRTALSSDPSSVSVRHLVAHAYLEMQLVDAAVVEYEELLQRDPNDILARERLGVLLLPSSPEEASEHLSQAATPLALEILEEPADNSSADLLARVGQICIRKGEWGLGAFVLEQATSLQPEFSDAYALLGQSLGQLGRDEEALDHLERAVELEPESPLAHSLLGLYRLREGDPAAAQLHFETAYDLDPGNAAVCLNLAYVHSDLGQYGPADIWMREALRLAEGSPLIWEAAARFYLDRHFVPSGLETSQRLVELEPDSAVAVDLLAWAHFLSGQISQAEEGLQQATTLDPSLAVAHFHLGEVHSYRGRHAAAEAAFRRALDLATDPGLRSAIEQHLLSLQ